MTRMMVRNLALALLLAGLPGAALAQPTPPVRPVAATSTDPAAARVERNEPIEITAEQLDVYQDQKIAIFRGAVDAIQGPMRLKAEELKVFYTGSPESSSGRTGGGGSSISKLAASGGVQMWNPVEQAKGETAIYDLEARTIRMSGNVILTRGKNTLQGSHLTIDLTTGRSKLEGGSAQSSGQRVKGLFEAPKDAPATGGAQP